MPRALSLITRQRHTHSCGWSFAESVSSPAARTHAVVSFVASGHVLIIRAEDRTPLACFRTTAGFNGFRQAHAGFPTGCVRSAAMPDALGRQVWRGQRLALWEPKGRRVTQGRTAVFTSHAYILATPPAPSRPLVPIPTHPQRQPLRGGCQPKRKEAGAPQCGLGGGLARCWLVHARN